MTIETTRYDVAEYLTSDERIAAYLEAAFEDGDPALITAAINDVARARGMTEIAKRAGIARGTLYKALGEGANPTLSTLLAVMKALDVRLSVEPVAA